MADGSSYFDEIYQELEMSVVEFSIHNVPEAETIFTVTNKNTVAYLRHYILGLEEEISKRVVKNDIDPSLVHTVDTCS